MAGPEDNSSLSLEASMEDLFAEAVASVERHKKGGSDTDAEDAREPALEVDLDLGALGEDLDDALSEGDPFDEGLPPVEGDSLGEEDPRLQDALADLEALDAELTDAKAQLARREREIAAMIKRFEDAQRLYRIKVAEARQATERSQELQGKNDHLAGELRKAIDRIKRQNAQVEALRRRYGKEQEELKRFGSEKPFLSLLSVLDNFERAIEHQGASATALREGVEITHSQFVSVLQDFGVRRVKSNPGDPFDPGLHEAMVRVETESVPNGAIYEVLQTGYTYHDRLLRPTRVSVGRQATPEAAPATPSLPDPHDDALASAHPDPDLDDAISAAESTLDLSLDERGPDTSEGEDHAPNGDDGYDPPASQSAPPALAQAPAPTGESDGTPEASSEGRAPQGGPTSGS